VITDDALNLIPLSVLLTREPRKDVRTGGVSEPKLSNAAWLIRKYSISVLPSVSSLTALRKTTKSTQATSPFVGFGDPLFSDHPTLGGITTKRSLRQINALRLFRGDVADVETLRSVPSLPETDDELKSIAHSLGATTESLFLRESATEKNVRSIPLTAYRVIAFATHGVVSGELNGIAEPGLLLTPPKSASEEDDGILTASEVATLKLDADWVLLSACNTASSDGRQGAEGFSGLGKAFSYAGARSLVVSHWSVPSDSTAALTTRMFQTYSKSNLSKSEAHRQAMLSLIEGDGGKYSHPTFWAPFVIMGDGGRPTAYKR
jgi:CHAT domain-containing protein